MLLSGFEQASFDRGEKIGEEKGKAIVRRKMTMFIEENKNAFNKEQLNLLQKMIKND